MIVRRKMTRIVVLLIAVVSVITTACGSETGGNASAGAPSETELPIMSTSSGYAITLETVELTEQDSTFAFSITRVAKDAPALERYLPFTPADVEFEGLSIKSSNFGSYKPVLAEDGLSVDTVWATFEFDPITDPNTNVNITFRSLSFTAPSTGGVEQKVEGEWSFEIDPSSIVDAEFRSIDLDASVTRQGITFAVERVAFYPSHTFVAFDVNGPRDAQLEMNGIVAQADDGEPVMATSMELQTDGTYEAEFPPLPHDVPITLSLAPVLQEVRQQGRITIPIADQAEKLRSTVGAIPVRHRFGFAGEQLIIDYITAESNVFTIRVDNDMPDHVGTVLLRFPNGGSGVQLVDNLGNDYELVGASSNFRKDSLLSMWADGSSFTFEGSLADGVSELTLSVDSHGKQLRGPWQVTIPAP